MVETRKSKLMGATPNVEVHVTLPSGRTVVMHLLPGDNIQRVCERIAEEEGVAPDRVNCKYTGKVLNKSHTLGYLGVCPDTVLKAEIVQIKKYTVYVKLPEGKTSSLQIENVSPVRYIQELIESTESIPANRQQFKVGGRTITNLNQRVMDAGITDEAVITLELKKEINLFKKSAATESPESKAAEPEPDLCEADKDAVLSSFDAAGKNVEVAFCFDTTGSMYSCLDQVRSKLTETCRRLIQEIANIRISIMAQGDYCDYSNYVVRYLDLTNDVESLVSFVHDVPATGGGDSPECYEWSLRKAQMLDWSENSAKAFVLIGDCEPHCKSYTDQKVNWHEELDVLSGMGVKVYGVQAQNNTHVKPFYQELAERTGGAYIQFKNFSIITEMFLAVCYREASNEQYEAFCQEMAGNDEDEKSSASAEGGNAEAEKKRKDVQAILQQLDQQTDKQEDLDAPRRYVAQAWWDPLLDKGSPSYSYDGQNDKWGPYKGTRDTYTPSLMVDSSVTPERRKSFTGPSTTTKKASVKKRSFSLRRKSRATSAKADDKKSCSVM